MERFSLFELEQLPLEILLKEFPEARGQNEYQTRANIALELKEEGTLKDCPLYGIERIEITNEGRETRENSELFLKLLSSTPNEILDMVRDINTSLYKIVRLNIIPKYNGYRLLCIYTIYSILIRLGFNSNDDNIEIDYNIENKYLFEHVLHPFDESYHEYIESMTNEELFEFYGGLGVSLLWANLDIQKEIAKRYYDDIQLGNDTLFKTTPYNYVQLMVLATQIEDDNMIQRINDIFGDYLDKVRYFYYYKIEPSVKTVRMMVKNYKKLKIKIPYELLVIYGLIALSSVIGTSPYSTITFENFTKILKYLIEISKVSCEKFLTDMAKEVKTEKLRVQLLSIIMLRLCGKSSSTISQLASKAMSMSYIPEGYYQ